MEFNIDLVKDISPTTPFFSDSIQFNDLLYFSASEGELGRKLWVSDGTTEGTKIVKDVTSEVDGTNESYYSFSPRNFIEFSERLFFLANDSENGEALWVSDGTSEGTQLFKDIYVESSETSSFSSFFAEEFTVVGDLLYFSANDGENGVELWASDGTVEGTQLVKDINPGITDRYYYPFVPEVDSSTPRQLTAVGDLLYFTAEDGENGRELWVSDGTTEGTKLVKDINPGFNDSGYLITRAPVETRPVENPLPLGSDINGAIEFNDKLYFRADDGENGSALWVSDGTTEGTQLLSSDVFFAGREATEFIEFDDRLFFSGFNSEQGEELWVTDGTAEGTQLFKDINPSFGEFDSDNPAESSTFPNDSRPRNFAVLNDKLLFTADNGVVGTELWVTDGTNEGTTLVKDIEPEVISYDDGSTFALGSGIYDEFIEYNDRLYFSARVEGIGSELWVTDGTTEGTQLVEDLRPGASEGYSDNDVSISYSSFPSFLDVANDALFFGAENDATGSKLFKLTTNDSDSGTEANSKSIEASSSASIGDDSNSVYSSSSSGSSSSDGTFSSSSSSSIISIAGSVTLTGGDGGDRLTGNSGDDLLDGNLGDDTLAGGMGSDTFVLRAGDGTDTITDFELGSDRLGLASGLHFSDLTFSGHSILLGEEVLADLNGVNTEQLTNSNFDFI